MRLVHLLEVLKTTDRESLQELLMKSMIESPNRNVEELEYEPGLVHPSGARLSTVSVIAGSHGKSHVNFMQRMMTFKGSPNHSVANFFGASMRRPNKVHDSQVLKDEKMSFSQRSQPTEAGKGNAGSIAGGNRLISAGIKTQNRKDTKSAHLRVPEAKRKKIKELFTLLESLWKSVSMGATTVPV